VSRPQASRCPDGRVAKITRADFEAAVRPLILRTREPLEVCLRESPGPIDHLVMVGGSSRIPAVQQRFVADVVGAEPSAGADPMTAIAEGAAIAAGILQGTITDLDFYVGTEHALGTVTHDEDDDGPGEFSVLIGRNTKYPARAAETYTPKVDFQEQVLIEVVEGDPAKPIGHEDNVVLSNWLVTLPQRRRRADAAFDITYRYDVDGILHVLVRDGATDSVLMEEHLVFGAGIGEADLAEMRQRVERSIERAEPKSRP
jgi:molecular chaperone DnaK